MRVMQTSLTVYETFYCLAMKLDNENKHEMVKTNLCYLNLQLNVC